MANARVCSQCGYVVGGELSRSAVRWWMIPLGVVFVGIVLLLAGTAISPDRSVRTAQRDATPGVDDAVRQFLAGNPQFGTHVWGIEPLPNWQYGQRRAVETSKGRFMLYFYSGEVVAVWSRNHSQRLWRKPGYSVPSAIEGPRDPREATSRLPTYQLIDVARLMSGGKEGDVLIPTFSRRTPLAEREAFARSIASSEELTTVNLYCSREAQTFSESPSPS